MRRMVIAVALTVAIVFAFTAFLRTDLEKAAAQGDTGAQTLLGVMYAQGQGVKQDYAKARELFEKAAVQGLADAQFRLGVMYAQGQGVKQDYVAAYRWFSIAAVGGAKEAAKARDKVACLMDKDSLLKAQAREYFEKQGEK